ncbi:hypothetical protein Nhal_0955 [Nitrosococcus halophilus Nc 4]|uniref:STAS domain-containing protein n=1 Tax=Nitrosococcus halophilus (strain Nc4) TaxID=472759 RepID=D5BYE5_NITHN|nr:hypothetical protein [Nitrosococcus halophilus]ADE14128.1 hypothetical protein Nhal_0955 [Nitrosococcus halophilus Nc 4]
MSLATHLAVAHSLGAKVEDHATFLTSPEVLDFALCREFWEAAQQVRDSEMKVIIDLSKTHSIRDSGYTLLWMLKDSLNRGCQVFCVTNFHLGIRSAKRMTN